MIDKPRDRLKDIVRKLDYIDAEIKESLPRFSALAKQVFGTSPTNSDRAEYKTITMRLLELNSTMGSLVKEAEEVAALYDGMAAQRLHSHNLQIFIPLRNPVGAKAFDYASGQARHFTIVGSPTDWASDHAPVAEPWGLQVTQPQPSLDLVVAGPDRVKHRGLDVGPAVRHEGLAIC